MRNFITTHSALGAFFDALIQRTDCFIDVPWLLVQPHHSIRCSYKRYTNRHLSQHMIFQYCDEDSGEPVQQSLLCIEKKIERSNRFLDVNSWDYDNI